mmetsp:Transcript_10326/g.20863  ORF Transcript_10326/g.20863 Transcript_10326/m.20863 type:complete len:115 (-) Transcript_10326:258-602(-)
MSLHAGHIANTTHLEDLVARKDWNGAVRHMGTHKGRHELSVEGGVPIFEAAAVAFAPLCFFKQGLRQLGKHMSRVRPTLTTANAGQAISDSNPLNSLNLTLSLSHHLSPPLTAH